MLDDLPDGTMIYRDNMDEQELEEDAVRTPMAYLGIVPSLYAMMVTWAPAGGCERVHLHPLEFENNGAICCL